MTRIVFNQTDGWYRATDTVSAYSPVHCCYCGRSVKPGSPLLHLSRTDDGEWWLVDPGEPVAADERDFGRFSLPVGPDCLRRHPEWRFALVPETPAAR